MSLNDSLISNFLVLLDSKYSGDTKFSKILPNYEKLKDSLLELDKLIEMDNVKFVIVKQIKFILRLAHENLENPNMILRRLDGHMIHTVFYGNPGVGKSRTALLLARCWDALGLLQPCKEGIKLNGRDLLNKINGNRATFLELYESYKSNLKSKSSDLWKSNSTKWECIKSGFKDLGDELSFCISQNYELTPKPESTIVICGREDFVAEYSGQTSIKTSNFLKNNLGKCLIIEEAYLLCHSEADTYGMEAITVLNRFMDEYNEQIIIIFTGYEELLKKTIFKYQPGLQRRCQWYFDLKGYSPLGLSQIFTNQLNNVHWNIDQSLNLVNFFENNFENFPNFGGDTQKLVLQCKLIHSEETFETLGEVEHKLIIDENILSKAFIEYKKQNIF